MDAVQSLAKQLFFTAGLASVASDLDATAYDKKVLDDFMTSSGRLKTIPAQRKKRNVILRHIVQEFEPGQKYSERQINNILKRYHEDTALLRREMVEEKLLAREGGQYWRVDSGDTDLFTGRPRRLELGISLQSNLFTSQASSAVQVVVPLSLLEWAALCHV